MNLNTENWEYFDFNKIFVIRKGFYNKKPETSEIGDINFLGATDHNNGVTEKYTLDEIENSSRTGVEPNEPMGKKLFPAKAVCVTNNGSVGYAYYQSTPFTCSHDVNPLYRIDDDFNEFTGLFIATVIMHDKYRWGYGRKWRPERMIKSKLKLPIKRQDGGAPIIDEELRFSDKGFMPDWQFMEDYVKSLHSKVLTTERKNISTSLNTSLWKPFLFGKLIKEIYKATAYSKIELEISKNNKNGFIRFISRTEYNNGIDCYVNKDDFTEIEEGNAIAVGDTTSTITYQSSPFVNGDHIIIIRADWINKFTGMFIVSLLRKERFRYSYGRAFLMDSIKNTKILLPIVYEEGVPKIDKEQQFSDNGYIPDWQWIENYIKSLPYSDKI